MWIFFVSLDLLKKIKNWLCTLSPLLRRPQKYWANRIPTRLKPLNYFTKKMLWVCQIIINNQFPLTVWGFDFVNQSPKTILLMNLRLNWCFFYFIIFLTLWLFIFSKSIIYQKIMFTGYYSIRYYFNRITKHRPIFINYWQWRAMTLHLN